MGGYFKMEEDKVGERESRGCISSAVQKVMERGEDGVSE